MALFVSREPTTSSSRSQVSAKVDWDPAIRLRRTGRGKASDPVRLDGRSLDVALEKIASRVGPAVSAAFEEFFVPVAEDAFDEWPVASGYSRSRLFVTVEEAGDLLEMGITNDADYAGTIEDGDLVERLLFRPIEEAVDQVTRMIAKEISR